MRKNILSMESRYRNNKDETLHVYGSSGNIITSFGGKGAEVRFNSKGIPENTILTREFGIIILCNKPAFINDVNIE